jgi:hypothetical protein
MEAISRPERASALANEEEEDERRKGFCKSGTLGAVDGCAVGVAWRAILGVLGVVSRVWCGFCGAKCCVLCVVRFLWCWGWCGVWCAIFVVWYVVGCVLCDFCGGI